MQGLKNFLTFCLTFSIINSCFGQSEALKNVVNNLAFYKEKKDIKYLSNAKKSVDSLFTTHADSLNLQKNVYRALVYSSILYTDSLNKLNLPPGFFTQTRQLIDKLIIDKGIYRYQGEIDYSKKCLANVLLKKGFVLIQKSDFINALKYFLDAKSYSPDFKPVDEYIAFSNSKLGNLQIAAKYYSGLINSDSAKVSYVQAVSSIYKLSGDTVSALEALKKGRKLFPQEKSLLLEEASIYNSEKNYRLLAGLLPNMLEINSANADIAYVGANCYDHLKQYDNAASLYLRSIELNSTAYDPVFDLGLLYFKLTELKKEKADSQDMNRAIQWLQKANDISPDNINGIKALQMAYLRTGNKDQYNNMTTKLNQFNK